MGTPLRKAVYILATLFIAIVCVEGLLRVTGLLYEKARDASFRKSGDPGAPQSVVLCYGGSFVRGMPDSNYPMEMEKIFSARRPDRGVRVINLARRALDNSADIIERLPVDTATFRPEVIIVNFNFRENAVKHKRRGGGYSARLWNGLVSLVEGSRIFQLLVYASGRYSMDAPGRARPADERALARGPASARVLLEQGRLHTLLEDAPRAELSYLAALEREDSPVTRLALGSFYLREGRYRTAKKHIEKAVLEKPSPQAHLAMAEVCRYLGDSAAMERHAAQVKEGPGRDVNTIIRLALWYQSEGDYRRAEETFKEAVERWDRAEGRLALALFYGDRERFGEAETILRATLKEPGAEAAAHRAMAFFLNNRGDLVGAEHHFKKAVAAAKNKDDARMILAFFYVRQGRYLDAEKEAAVVAARRGGFEDYVTLARIYRNQKKYSEMEAPLKKALAIHKSPRLYGKLFDSYLNGGDLQAAEATIEKTFDEYDSEFYVVRRRKLYLKQGRNDLARDYLPTFEALRENLEWIIRFCRRENVALYFENAGLTEKVIENRVRETARRHGVPFIDVMREFAADPERSRIMGGEQHFSRYGNRWLARLIARHVESALN